MGTGSNRTPTALEQFYMLLLQNNGINLPKRPIANFITGTLTDDPVNNCTIIDPGAGGSGTPITLSSPFVQPAIGQPVTATVSTSASWALGETLFVPGGGFYVASVFPTTTSVTLINTNAPGNAAPGTTVSPPAVVVGSGPPWMRIQALGTDVTQRGILDFEDGLALSDDAVNGRMVVRASRGAPQTISGTGTVANGKRWVLAAPGSLITMPAAPIENILFTPTADTGTGPIGLLAGSGPELQWPNVAGGSSGSGRFTVAAEVFFVGPPGASFEYELDTVASPNIYRCIRVA